MEGVEVDVFVGVAEGVGDNVLVGVSVSVGVRVVVAVKSGMVAVPVGLGNGMGVSEALKVAVMMTTSGEG